MPGRRQKVTDDEVFAAAHRAMSRRGPHELTLADIAEEAGVTAGRLVQRFGSKRALLVALSERFAGSAAPMFASLRKAHRSPLATLRAYGLCMADLAPTPEALLRNLAYLQDPAMFPDLVQQATAFLLEALVVLYESSFEPRWFAAARELADTMIGRFAEEERGGFFETSNDHERLVARRRAAADQALHIVEQAGTALPGHQLSALAQLVVTVISGIATEEVLQPGTIDIDPPPGFSPALLNPPPAATR